MHGVCLTAWSEKGVGFLRESPNSKFQIPNSTRLNVYNTSQYYEMNEWWGWNSISFLGQEKWGSHLTCRHLRCSFQFDNFDSVGSSSTFHFTLFYSLSLGQAHLILFIRDGFRWDQLRKIRNRKISYFHVFQNGYRSNFRFSKWV